jgi:hypothetical protein
MPAPAQRLFLYLENTVNMGFIFGNFPQNRPKSCSLSHIPSRNRDISRQYQLFAQGADHGQEKYGRNHRGQAVRVQVRRQGTPRLHQEGLDAKTIMERLGIRHKQTLKQYVLRL